MRFGIQSQDYQLLEKFLITPVKAMGGQIWIFGSRVTAKHHPFADVDLLVELPTGSSAQISVLRSGVQSLSETRFPFKVDLVLSDQLADAYRPNVEKTKVAL